MPTILNYTIAGSLLVPDGTKLSETEQEFILPCGEILKIWEAVEDHNKGEDLGEIELNDLGVVTGLEFERNMEIIEDVD